MHSRKLLAFGFIMAIGCASSSIIGQSRVNSSGTGGIHVIQGRVYLPNGRGLDNPVKVELQSSTDPSLSVYTDHSGAYRFSGIRPGNYTIVADAGESFETAREYVTIDPEVQVNRSVVRSTTKTFTIPLHLQFKRGVKYRSGVINAKWATIPRDAIEHYEKGLELEQEGKLTEAIVEFKSSTEIAPSFAPAHGQLGSVYLRKGQLDEAVSSLRTAVRFDSTDYDARVHLGIALLNQMDFDGAEKELVEAAFLNTHAVAPHYYIGRLYIAKKNYDIAQKAFEKAKELKRENEYPLLHKYLGGIYEAKKLTKQAVEELETYLRLEPDAKDADRIRKIIADLKTKQT